MGIIAGLKSGIKGLLGRISADGVIVAIILLSSSAAFGLGFLAGKDVGQKGELKIEQLQLEAAVLPAAQAAIGEGQAVAASVATLPAGGQYVASKTGKSYHLPWCPGAKQIKEENKVWFSSKEDAEAKGYKPAGNCPGI